MKPAYAIAVCNSLISIVALAAKIAPAQAAGCAPLGEPIYSAVLKAEPTSSATQSDVTRSVVKTRYRIVIASELSRKAGVGPAPLVAQIRPIVANGEGECVAVCELKHWDRTPGETQYVDLACRAPHGLPLISSATLLWPRNQAPAMLRFGTWLGGYKPYPLTVEIDRYSLPAAREGVRLSRLDR